MVVIGLNLDEEGQVYQDTYGQDVLCSEFVRNQLEHRAPRRIILRLSQTPIKGGSFVYVHYDPYGDTLRWSWTGERPTHALFTSLVALTPFATPYPRTIQEPTKLYYRITPSPHPDGWSMGLA